MAYVPVSHSLHVCVSIVELMRRKPTGHLLRTYFPFSNFQTSPSRFFSFVTGFKSGVIVAFMPASARFAVKKFIKPSSMRFEISSAVDSSAKIWKKSLNCPLRASDTSPKTIMDGSTPSEAANERTMSSKSLLSPSIDRDPSMAAAFSKTGGPRLGHVAVIGHAWQTCDGSLGSNMNLPSGHWRQACASCPLMLFKRWPTGQPSNEKLPS